MQQCHFTYGCKLQTPWHYSLLTQDGSRIPVPLVPNINKTLRITIYSISSKTSWLEKQAEARTVTMLSLRPSISPITTFSLLSVLCRDGFWNNSAQSFLHITAAATLAHFVGIDFCIQSLSGLPTFVDFTKLDFVVGHFQVLKIFAAVLLPQTAFIRLFCIYFLFVLDLSSFFFFILRWSVYSLSIPHTFFKCLFLEQTEILPLPSAPDWTQTTLNQN